MKKIFIGLTVIVSVICCLCLTVSAEDSTNIQFFDFDEYAKYSADNSTGLIVADVQLPTSWQWTYVHDGANFGAWHNTFNFTSSPIDSPIVCDFNSFAHVNVQNTVIHGQLQSGNFLDLQYLPNGSTLNIEFVTSLVSRNLTSNFADVFVAYVDSTGKVIKHETVPTSIKVYQLSPKDGPQYTITASYTFGTVPSNAKGFYYVTRLSCGVSVDGEEIPVFTSKNSIVFKYSDLDYNIKQDQIIRDKVSNIEKQLGDLVNRPMVPIAPPGQNDFDDLHNNEQELLDQSQNYLDNGLSFFQNASGVILGLGNGFEAIKLLVQPVFALPFANSLITVSISLGLVATLIGVFISAVSNGGSEKESAKSGKKSAQGGKSAPKGGKK